MFVIIVVHLYFSYVSQSSVEIHLQCGGIYSVSQKNIPDIFDCNLKSSYQILIIFDTNIPDTTCHQN